MNSWSGITYQLYHTLESDHEVFWPGPIKPAQWENRLIYFWRKWQDLLGKKYTAHFTLNAKILASNVRKMFRDEDYDCIVVGAGESELIAHLKTSLPIIYVADTTFNNMVDYYPWHTGLCKKAIRQGNQIEQMAIDRAAYIIYSSDWAAHSAISKYGASPNKISVAAFGDSLKTAPDKHDFDQYHPSETCRLLFIGTNWERKGGPFTMQIFQLLKERGITCFLTIAGSNPVLEIQSDVLVIPYLDKRIQEDTQLMDKLYTSNDLLLLPTRADCTPIVFSEAAAYGMPVITTDTGGISSVVRPGENGYYLPLSSSASDYADLIQQIWENKESFVNLRKRSRETYEKRLNWKNWLGVFNHVTADLRS